MELNFDALGKALNSYRNSIESLEKAKIHDNTDHNMINTIKMGIIQNFEFTYELCWKYMKRWLGFNVSRNEVEGITRRHLFRLAAKHGLIDDVDKWMLFHEARNQTSHIYDEKIAEEVYQVTIEFISEAEHLYQKLLKKND